MASLSIKSIVSGKLKRRTQELSLFQAKQHFALYNGQMLCWKRLRITRRVLGFIEKDVLTLLHTRKIWFPVQVKYVKSDLKLDHKVSKKKKIIAV